jgi:Leucine-rich repeat (LRR) protein
LNFAETTGSFPAELASLTKLTYLDLTFNSLRGQWRALPASLRHLDVTGADVSGTLPSSWPPALTYLSISLLIKISGTLPAVWPAGLAHIDVSHVGLVGHVPPLPAALTSLNLESNFLQGNLVLPPSLVMFPIYIVFFLPHLLLIYCGRFLARRT